MKSYSAQTGSKDLLIVQLIGAEAPDLCDIRCSVIVSAKYCGYNISELTPSWDLHALQRLEFTETDVMNKEHPTNGISVAKNILLMGEGRGEWSGLIKAFRKAEMTSQCNNGVQKGLFAFILP